MLAPGEGFYYSNTNWVLLGMLVEEVTGRSLSGELRRRILRPLQLRQTVVPEDRSGIRGPESHGYSTPVTETATTVAGLVDVTYYNPSWAWAAGNMTSSARDLQTFFAALLGGDLLPPELLAEMTAWENGGGGVLERYGLGLSQFTTPCGTFTGHEGDVPGYSTFPFTRDDGYRFVIMVNQYLRSEEQEAALGQALQAVGCAGLPAGG